MSDSQSIEARIAEALEADQGTDYVAEAEKNTTPEQWLERGGKGK